MAFWLLRVGGVHIRVRHRSLEFDYVPGANRGVEATTPNGDHLSIDTTRGSYLTPKAGAIQGRHDWLVWWAEECVHGAFDDSASTSHQCPCATNRLSGIDVQVTLREQPRGGGCTRRAPDACGLINTCRSGCRSWSNKCDNRPGIEITCCTPNSQDVDAPQNTITRCAATRRGERTFIDTILLGLHIIQRGTYILDEVTEKQHQRCPSELHVGGWPSLAECLRSIRQPLHEKK